MGKPIEVELVITAQSIVVGRSKEVVHFTLFHPNPETLKKLKSFRRGKQVRGVELVDKNDNNEDELYYQTTDTLEFITINPAGPNKQHTQVVSFYGN